MSDNQPQVGTCPRCGSDNKSAFRQGGGLPVGSCWFPDDFDDWHRQVVPQPAPAEPRIETDLAQRAKLQARLGNQKAVIDPQDIGAPRLNEEPRIETVPDEFQQDWADYDRRGIAGGWEKVAFTSGWGRGFKRGEARAGSSPKLERSDSDYAIEHGGYLADAAQAYLDEKNRFDAASEIGSEEVQDSDSLSDHFSALRDAIYEFRKRAKRASPPSSPGADQTPDYESLCELAARVLLQHMNDEDYEMSLAGLYARLTEHTLSSPGAPQEQK